MMLNIWGEICIHKHFACKGGGGDNESLNGRFLPFIPNFLRLWTSAARLQWFLLCGLSSRSGVHTGSTHSRHDFWLDSGGRRAGKALNHTTHRQTEGEVCRQSIKSGVLWSPQTLWDQLYFTEVKALQSPAVISDAGVHFEQSRLAWIGTDIN